MLCSERDRIPIPYGARDQVQAVPIQDSYLGWLDSHGYCCYNHPHKPTLFGGIRR